jgi:hypothetical protein
MAGCLLGQLLHTTVLSFPLNQPATVAFSNVVGKLLNVGCVPGFSGKLLGDITNQMPFLFEGCRSMTSTHLRAVTLVNLNKTERRPTQLTPDDELQLFMILEEERHLVHSPQMGGSHRSAAQHSLDQQYKPHRCPPGLAPIMPVPGTRDHFGVASTRGHGRSRRLGSTPRSHCSPVQSEARGLQLWRPRIPGRPPW